MEQQIVKRKQKSYYKKIRPTQPEINWNFRFMQLKDYKKRFGNCEVPQNWPENKQLGRWVIRQRTYKWRLIPERVDALNSIGFSWNTLDKNWEANFKELVAFKEKFGHCDVSKYGQYRKLGDWLLKQRRDKRYNLHGITEYKIQKLTALGVKWDIYKKIGWENQFQNLLLFKERYGHTQVPQRWSENKTLANWVSIQRRDKHKLSPEKLKKLQEIGFAFKPVYKRGGTKA